MQPQDLELEPASSEPTRTPDLEQTSLGLAAMEAINLGPTNLEVTSSTETTLIPGWPQEEVSSTSAQRRTALDSTASREWLQSFIAFVEHDLKLYSIIS